jgi:hypothetical protein
LPPASFVREVPNNQSAVPVTAIGHCPVPVLPRRAKTSFPRREAAPLRFAAPSAWSRKVAAPVSTPPVPPPWPPAHGKRTGGQPRQREQRVSGDLREKQKHRNSLRRPVAAVAAQWAGFWNGPGHDAGAATVPTEPPPGGVNLGRVLTDDSSAAVDVPFRQRSIRCACCVPLVRLGGFPYVR